ncbi:hypothetical protein P7K49_006976 [Saguinus oedipus]|uniref:Uncharacterized protein n=1 Tax=Saguinus oedipus TaxID=9490 RepID=A0ABQ9W4J0_SAGOE|nr:hypothetical protein P7K49_006976 [Saguinus oedipus]
MAGLRRPQPGCYCRTAAAVNLLMGVFQGTAEIYKTARGGKGKGQEEEGKLLQFSADNIFRSQRSLPRPAAPYSWRAGRLRVLGTASCSRPGAFVRRPLRPGRSPRFVWRARVPCRGPASCSFVHPSLAARGLPSRWSGCGARSARWGVFTSISSPSSTSTSSLHAFAFVSEGPAAHTPPIVFLSSSPLRWPPFLGGKRDVFW